MAERPLRLGTFLAPRMRPLYQEAAAALGAELVEGAAFSDAEDGTLDAAFLCGLPYVRLRGVEPLVAPAEDGDEPVYWSDVVARPGEPAGALEQFAGRRLGVNEPDSHSGHNVILATLARRGVPVGTFSEVVVTGSHAASLAAVTEGSVDTAAVDSHLRAALGSDGLTTVERLGPSPSQPLVAGPGVTAAERDRIREVLTALPPGETGLRWVAVDDAAYDPIRAMTAEAEARGGF